MMRLRASQPEQKKDRPRWVAADEGDVRWTLISQQIDAMYKKRLLLYGL